MQPLDISACPLNRYRDNPIITAFRTGSISHRECIDFGRSHIQVDRGRNGTYVTGGVHRCKGHIIGTVRRRIDHESEPRRSAKTGNQVYNIRAVGSNSTKNRLGIERAGGGIKVTVTGESSATGCSRRNRIGR